MKRRSFSPFVLAMLLSALVLSMIPVGLAWADEELEDPPLAIEESASSDDEEEKVTEDELSAQSDYGADADEGVEVPDEQPVATNPEANPIEEAAPDGLVAMAATNIQQLPDAPYRNNIWPLSDGENFAYAVYDSSANTVTVKRYNITNGDSSTLKTFSGYLRFGTYYAVNDKLYYTASTFRS